MTRLALVGALCVTVFLPRGEAATPLEFGMDMCVRAHEAVCWYENLKQFPNTAAKKFQECHGKQEFQKKQIETNEFFKDNPDQKEEYFGKWSKDKVIKSLPQAYQDACKKYYDTPKADPPADESDTLNDGGNTYPYRAYAYCLMKTLRERHGDKATDAVKNEKTHSRKNWMQAILDRDNEFRKRHGVPEFQLVKDLNTAAQKWADKNAAECKSYHSKNNDTGRQWRGEGTGESLFAGGGEDDKEISAYGASDSWYEEIKDYPYPDGYQGDDKELFEKIGHFTQSVWKETKYVGYGYAYNPDCRPFTRYITARYAPAGNGQGKYKDNVMPIQE